WNYRSPSSGWTKAGSAFVHAAAPDATPGDDWIIYRHWDPARRRYGPVRDFYAYNGAEVPADNEVADLGLEAGLTIGDAVESISVALRSGWDRFVVRIPVALHGDIEVVRNGRRVPIAHPLNPFAKGRLARPVTLEASVFDRQLTVAVDGQLLFDP